MSAVAARTAPPRRHPPPAGLTEAEAAARLAAAPPAQDRSSRSYASIVRANVFTVFHDRQPAQDRQHHVQLLWIVILLLALITFLVDVAGWFNG